MEESYTKLLIRYWALSSNTLYFPGTGTKNLYWLWDRVKPTLKGKSRRIYKFR